MQRKLKEQEELALHEQRINESLKVLHEEDMKDFARYEGVLSIILCYGEERIGSIEGEAPLIYTLPMLFCVSATLVLLELQSNHKISHRNRHKLYW